MESMNNKERTGANGKSKFSPLFTLLFFALVFNGCSNDDKLPTLVSGGFNGTITATVDAEDWDLTSIRWVVPWNEPSIECNSGNCSLLGEQMGDEVSFSNNRFTISLPDPPPSGIDKVDVKYAFENFLNISGKLTYSNPDVQVVDVDFLAHTGNGFAGYFLNASSDKKTICLYVYAEGDVTITGGTNISVSLKRGWNRIYYTKGGNGNYTTKAPDSDMKWYFEDFGI